MKQIFINLPVKDLELSAKFYENLGFNRYSLFTDEDSKSMIYNENIYLMLQTKAFFSSFTKKSLPDNASTASVTFTLPVESLDKVNEIIENAIKAGGKETTPMQDEGFMQIRTVEDLDEYIWDIIYLDIEKFKEKTGNS